VIFLGLRDDPENFYPALDIVALTSKNEGTPLTLIEAMANARPVVATAVGGVGDLLGPSLTPESSDGAYRLCERGILVRPNDAHAFCRALARLIEDAALRSELGARGCRFVQENHSKERLVADVIDLYRELVPAEISPSAGQSHVEEGENIASIDHGRSGIHRIASRRCVHSARR
jgi:glycosyltransferase involved in cell wall biosynthesis